MVKSQKVGQKAKKLVKQYKKYKQYHQISKNITAKWSTTPYYFYYSLDDNNPVSGFNSKITLKTANGDYWGPPSFDGLVGQNVLMNNSDVLYLSAPGSWQNTVSDLSATFSTVRIFFTASS